MIQLLYFILYEYISDYNMIISDNISDLLNSITNNDMVNLIIDIIWMVELIYSTHNMLININHLFQKFLVNI